MATHDTSAPAAGDAVVFRASLASLVAVVFLAMGLSPIAFQGGWWFASFLLPVVVAVWLVRTSTSVDARGMVVRSLLRTRTVPWERVVTLRLVDRGWVRAVTRPAGSAPEAPSGAEREVALRGVRLRDLGRVGEASGGRISVPTPADVEAAAEHRRELEAAQLRVARLRESQEIEAELLGEARDGAEDATEDEATAGDVTEDSRTEDATADGGPTDDAPLDDDGWDGRTTTAAADSRTADDGGRDGRDA